MFYCCVFETLKKILIVEFIITKEIQIKFQDTSRTWLHRIEENIVTRLESGLTIVDQS